MGYVGFDPGSSGAAVSLNATGEVLNILRFKNASPHDVAEWLTEQSPEHVVLERVGAMPKQGVSSTFKFGRHYGQLEGVLAALKIPYTLVAPSKWQRALSCLTGGDKNITKARAQQMWPDQGVIHATADAMLIAEYCRREFSSGYDILD